MAIIISTYGLLQVTALLIYSNLNTQVFMNSTVHVYLHGSTILMLKHQLINYTDMGGTAFS